MAGHEWEDWFEREEFIGQISDMRVQNLQVERELVQKRTFTRWMNLHLEKCEPAIEVHDLFQDIQDGHILMALLEELSGCKLLHGFKKSSHRIFRLNNIAKVLSFLEERNVKLVSIDAADVADGNSSIILGLIWNIILFFQIKELTGNIRSQFPSSSSLSSIPTSSDSDTSQCSTPSDHRQTAASAMREQSKAIKKLLQWLQKRTRKYGVAVQDFGKSWTSGLAFLAVIKSIDPSLVDMRKALLRTARENLEDAFRIAHYSLGIPRLLEPEDVTINPPEEQSIIIYVSQFLEHFPEEPEEPSHLIERSISMCRLNYRDSDSDHMRNSSPRSLVSERSYKFQRDCAKPPPKILISSVSEDRSAMSPPYRAVAARSWSVEDFLADSSHMDDFSSSEQPNEPSRVVHTESNVDSPQLSYTHSPSGSSGPESFNAESVIGDSAISSPDSWMDSEFGVMPERFSESRSDSSLCDSGTAWEDVYRATPVEIMTLDEGFVPSIEDKAPDGQSITESFIDEGIYSLGSLESAQERIQGHSDEKNVKEVQEKEDNLEMNNKSMAFEQVPDQNETEITEEVDKMDTSLQQKGEVDREQEASFGMCDSKVLDNSYLLEIEQSPAISNNEQPATDHFEELLKQSSVQERAYGELKCLEKVVNLMGEAQDHEGQMNGLSESEDGGKGWEEVEGKTECTKTDLEEIKWEAREESEISKDGDEDEVETQDNDTEGVPKDCVDPKESSSSETWGVSVETNPTDQDVASNTSLDPRPGINIPLISIWLEPEEPDDEETYQPEGQWEKNEVNRAEATGKKGTDTGGESPQNPGELSRDSNKSDDINLVEIPSCLVTENGDTTSSEQTRDIESRHLDDTGKQEVGRSSYVDIRGTDTIDDVEKSEAKQEGVDNKCQTANTEKDLVAQASSSTDDTTQPVNKEQEMDITDRLDGDQDKLGETFSYNETANTQQQNTWDPINSKPNGGAGIWSGCVPRDMDYFSTDFDGRSLGDDLVGDLEPMDLFYPDKEQLMFTEPSDAEMQSWPSVLSVSALQPAPASDEQLLNLLDEDFTNGVDWIRENNKMIKESDQETAGASESQEQCLLPGEKMGGLLGGDPADGSEAEQWSSDCARENTGPVRSDSRAEEKQIAPVLRHRKGARSINSTDNQTAGTEASRNLGNADSNVWELYLLLLMWLLLYCFWLLPQMDLKTLPSMLLNRKH